MQTNDINTWLEAELNRRHKDFQSNALPTELSSHITYIKKENTLYIDWGEKNIGLSITNTPTKIFKPIFKHIYNKNIILILKEILIIYNVNLIYIGYFQKSNNPLLLKKINNFIESIKNLNIPIHNVIEYYTTCTAKNANKIKKKQKNIDTISAIFMNQNNN